MMTARLAATGHEARFLPSTDEARARFQTLARRVRATLGTDGPHCLGITASHQGAGVSTVARNLAGCLSEEFAVRTLLIDTHVNRPSAANRLGLARTHGLSDVLTGQAELRDALLATPHSALHVLPAGRPSARHVSLASEAGERLLEQLKREFPFIVLDLPPAAELDERLLSSSLVAGFLLVIEAERVRRQVASRIKENFARVNANLLGVVLNKREHHVPEWLYHKL